ncbi:cytochrome P450 4C1-like isoform X2 [Vespa velutina]|uniref:cytochrome P450 4C1-like isoform X2 n=1 Tax=Vespa velutina TaxID=202808 RepID=UPI001FB300B9|nr:cytochrome P450 4C1-like isoform X2 [Vespa velutina]
MYSIVILIIILTILFGLYYGIAEYFLNKLRMFNMINGIPGPKAFPIIGNHLFTGDTTALFKQILNLGNNCQLSYMDVFVNHSIALMEKLETFVGEELEVFNYVLRYTLDIIYDATLDTQINSLTNPDCKLAESIKCLMDIAIQRVCKLWLHPNIIFYNTARGKKFHASLAYLDNVTNKIIKEKMESMLRSKINRELIAEKDKNGRHFPIFYSSYRTKEKYVRRKIPVIK